MINVILNELNNEISIKIDNFKKFIDKICPEKINASIFNDVLINNNNKNFKLNDISSICVEKYNTIILTPYDKKNINLIYNNLLKNNSLDLEIFKYDNYIKISIPNLNKDRRKKFFFVVKKESENIKINIRNIRRNFNNKINNFFKIKKIGKDDKIKLIKQIDLSINKWINLIEEIKNKKEKIILNL